MSNRVPWNELEPGLFEDIGAVLISRLHPATRRIDGSGGDGGRDVHLPLADGLEIFELKSFTGRMTGARRRQVERSLARAASHEPEAWHLVVPIDPTPGEVEWFEATAAEYPFACDWRGRTWLDDQIASHPDIPRYFLEGAADEVVEVLRELNKEEAALTGGASDAIDRVRALARRLDGLDPHYAFGLTSTPDGTVTVSVTPKYRGAEHDRPIRLGGSLRFPDTEEGRGAARAFQESIEFGTPSEVPAEYIADFTVDMPAGLGGSFEGGHLRLGPPEGAAVEDVNMMLRVVDPDAHPTAQLPIIGETRTAGVRGAQMTLSDAIGAVSVVLRFDVKEQRLTMNYTFSEPGGALPGALLPAVRFVAAVRPGCSVELLFHGKVVATAPVTEVVDEGAAGYAALLSDLDTIQKASGVFFPMPDELSDEELQNIQTTERLMAGETITGTWSEVTMTATPAGLARLRKGELGAGPVRDVIQESQLTYTLAGNEISLGWMRQTFSSARVRTWPDVPADADPDLEIEIVLVPDDDDSTSWSLIEERSVT